MTQSSTGSYEVTQAEQLTDGLKSYKEGKSNHSTGWKAPHYCAVQDIVRTQQSRQWIFKDDPFFPSKCLLLSSEVSRVDSSVIKIVAGQILLYQQNQSDAALTT